jgi:hypothetical protein
MAVSDPQNLLGLEFPPLEKKYSELRRMFYLEGKPDLKGSLPVRFFDSFLLRLLGLILGFGKQGSDPKSDYKRLTGNIARPIGHLGSFGYWLLRLNFRTCANILVREGLYDVKERTDHVETAKEYLKILDLFDFNVAVAGKDNSKVEVKILECPVGYGHDDDLEVCKATMEFDHQCIRRLGGNSILKETIPDGASECLIDVLPAGS